MNDFALIPILWAGAYLAGSIPTGLVLSTFFNGIDIRDQGSGNIGAANVFRVAGRGPAALTLLGDAAKGCLPVILAGQLGMPLWVQLVAGLATIAGHNWSIFLRGRGGKGIATSVGAMAGLAPLVTVIALGVWAIVLLVSRYASLASLLMIGSVPVLLILFNYNQWLWAFGTILLVLAVLRHRANISRLMQGTELKIRLRPAGRSD